MTTVPMDSGFRAASAHTAVLISNLRKVTEHKTGLISAMAAGRWAESPAVKFSGWTSITVDVLDGNGAWICRRMALTLRLVWATSKTTTWWRAGH